MGGQGKEEKEGEGEGGRISWKGGTIMKLQKGSNWRLRVEGSCDPSLFRRNVDLMIAGDIHRVEITF